MATSAYLVGRKRHTRPQGVLWSENAGTLIDGLYVPTGQEIGANSSLTTGGINQFLILSDHNRSALDFKPNRIEQRERMINGNMRSYHIADKLTISFSWQNLPSRAYPNVAEFDAVGVADQTTEYTADGGAGGVELLDWYENHKGPFWMFLAYDKYNNFGKNDAAFQHLTGYNEIVQVYFNDFSYSVEKRGRTNHDLWNVSVSLEEV
jgi:hypothetical protein